MNAGAWQLSASQGTGLGSYNTPKVDLDGAMGLVQLQVVSPLVSVLPSILHEGLSPSRSFYLLWHGDKFMSCTMSRCWDIHPHS